LKIKTEASSKPLQSPRPQSKSAKTIRQEDVMDYFRQNPLSIELIDKILSTLLERQQTINRQLDESEKKLNLHVEESNRIINENEKIFFREMDEKKQQIEDNTIEIEIKEEERIKQLEDKKIVHKVRLEFDEQYICFEIIKKFNELGYYFDDITFGSRRILDINGNTLTELGIVLENINCLIAVELIANPKRKDIEHHINSLKILKEHRNNYKDKRKIYGAITVNEIGREEKMAILKNGIYLFEQSGKTVKLDMPDNFFPLEL
jgi:hypothetical protein